MLEELPQPRNREGPPCNRMGSRAILGPAVAARRNLLRTAVDCTEYTPLGEEEGCCNKLEVGNMSHSAPVASVSQELESPDFLPCRWAVGSKDTGTDHWILSVTKNSRTIRRLVPIRGWRSDCSVVSWP